MVRALNGPCPWVTGYGPSKLADIEGRGPLVPPKNGCRVSRIAITKDQEEYGSQPLPKELKAIDLPAVRAMGVEAAAREAVHHLTREELDGFSSISTPIASTMSSCRLSISACRGGLSWDELGPRFGLALASGKAVGIEITIYNPRLDEDGSAGRGLADVLAAALGTAAPSVAQGRPFDQFAL